MNIDKFLKIFVPKDYSFYPLFESAAMNLTRAATLLKTLVTSEQSEHERLYKEIKELEHIGDVITKRTYEQLNKSFITPFDREDIHELTGNIDDMVDTINGVARRIFLYKPKNLKPVYNHLSDLILDASKEIEAAVHSLKDPIANKDKIRKACDRVFEIEHDADEHYINGITELFEKEEDTKELMKNNKILEMLERCVDEAEDVTDTIKAILIKMA